MKHKIVYYIDNQEVIMKKIIFFIFILLGLSLLSAEEKKDLRFYSFGEFSYYPRLVDQLPKKLDGIQFGTVLAVGIEYKFLFIEIEQDVNIVKSTDIMFQPYREKYFIRAGVNFSAFSIQYEHLCVHSVSMNGNLGGHDKVSIMFDSRDLK